MTCCSLFLEPLEFFILMKGQYLYFMEKYDNKLSDRSHVRCMGTATIYPAMRRGFCPSRMTSIN